MVFRQRNYREHNSRGNRAGRGPCKQGFTEVKFLQSPAALVECIAAKKWEK